MTSDEVLQAAADALGESVLVAGCGHHGVAAVDRLAETADLGPAATVIAANAGRDGPETHKAADGGTDAADGEPLPPSVAPAVDAEPDALVVAVDIDDPCPISAEGARALGAIPLCVAVVAPSTHAVDGEVFTSLRRATDAVLVAPNEPGSAVDALVTGVSTFVALVCESGFVNIDLADARTVFEAGDFAVLGRGSTTGAEKRTPTAAVDAAVDTFPAGFDPARATGVLVDLIGGPEMSVEDVSEAVSAVRSAVGPTAHVIWGGAVAETDPESLEVRLVVAGVRPDRPEPQPTAGDDCPRCDGQLSGYSLGTHTTVGCDRCGYAGVSVQL